MDRAVGDRLWDAWCVASLIGIWPRFIEPRLLSTSRVEVRLPGLPKELSGLKVLQFSDLHFHAAFPTPLLSKLKRKIASFQPDIILFSGDFLCHATLADEQRLGAFLNDLEAPYGCFAVLGNHDYEKRVGLNPNGVYDIVDKEDSSLIKQGFKRLFSQPTISGTTTAEVRNLSPHATLKQLLQASPFTLLHNTCIQVPVRGSYLNVCGFGEYTCGQTMPEKAFVNYDRRYPGILLLHNPDGIPLLKEHPGDIVLCGHTHGGQVNIPGLWKKFTLLEHPQFKKGLVRFGDKVVYINRGIGSIFPFRWFAVPELLFLTLI